MIQSSIKMNSACTEEAGLRLDAWLGWDEGLMSPQRQAKYTGPILVVDNAITAQTHHATAQKEWNHMKTPDNINLYLTLSKYIIFFNLTYYIMKKPSN